MKLVVNDICYDAGIVPIKISFSPGSQLTLQEALKSMSPEDARIAKRKFRKQWRKLAKLQPSLNIPAVGPNEKPSLRKPSRGKRAQRRNAVAYHVIRLANVKVDKMLQSG